MRTCSFSIEQHIPNWLANIPGNLIFAMNQDGHPIYFNNALSRILADNIRIGEDCLSEILRYPNYSGKELINVMGRSESSMVLALNGRNLNGNSTRSLIWSDWVFNRVPSVDEVIFIGMGRLTVDMDISYEKSFYKNISKTISDRAIISVADRDGRIVMVNNNFCEFTQFDRYELIGKRHQDIMLDFHTKSFWRTMFATIKEGNAWNDDVKVQSKDGKTRWFHTLISPVFKENGELDRIMHFMFDVTEHKRFMMHQEKLSEIAFIQSHEFRRPIANMLGILDLFKTEPEVKSLSPKLTQWLDLLHLSVNQTDEIIAKIVSKTSEPIN